MTHKRVTEKGRAMGKNAARLAELGFRRLQSIGLDALSAPMLRNEMCKTCACRPGVAPNGCLQTQLDFLKSAHEGTPFRCHSPNDGRMCAGWVRVRAELVANPLPDQVVGLLAKWDYSPADGETKGATP
jgi:hypothetical protein